MPGRTQQEQMRRVSPGATSLQVTVSVELVRRRRSRRRRRRGMAGWVGAWLCEAAQQAPGAAVCEDDLGCLLLPLVAPAFKISGPHFTP